jgi:hypothetical protein
MRSVKRSERGCRVSASEHTTTTDRAYVEDAAVSGYAVQIPCFVKSLVG